MFFLYESTDGNKYYLCQDCGLMIEWSPIFEVRHARLAHHRCDPDQVDS